MQTVAIAYREDADVVAQIDRLVIERRRIKPEHLFSRARFIKEAVQRVLAEDAVPDMRERQRVAVQSDAAA